MSEPTWLLEAIDKCPTEAAEFALRKAELQALEKDASTTAFITLYEQMLAARDRLYEAWLSQEMDS